MRANAVLGSPGWAWGLILLLCDAGLLWASSSPSVRWAHLTVRTNGGQKSENHFMLKRVDSGARLPGSIALQLLCKMHDLGCKCLKFSGPQFLIYKMGNNSTSEGHCRDQMS